MRSVGVTAVMEATMPEHIPASMFLPGERVPVSGSEKDCLMVCDGELGKCGIIAKEACAKGDIRDT